MSTFKSILANGSYALLFDSNMTFCPDTCATIFRINNILENEDCIIYYNRSFYCFMKHKNPFVFFINQSKYNSLSCTEALFNTGVSNLLLKGGSLPIFSSKWQARVPKALNFAKWARDMGRAQRAHPQKIYEKLIVKWCIFWHTFK